MQLVIDIGNTRVKTAVFEEKELRHFQVFPFLDETIIPALTAQFNISSCIVCSVVNEIEAFIKETQLQLPVLLFNSQTPVPVKNLYRSAHTLGSDRLAAAVAGNLLAPSENVLIIDAGTCIKYNFVNVSGEYLGGAISPGLQMRFNALNHYTARLPLLKISEDYSELIGTTSEESILSGVELGAAAEVSGIIDQYSQRFNNIKVFLTGGDADFFAKRLKKPIFADQFLILKGLNEILQYNKLQSKV